MALSYDKLRAKVADRIWYRANGAFAFLVDAPHTFGHSQLVLKVPTSCHEERSFAKAAGHAAKCVGLLRMKLPTRRTAWRQLTDYTMTSGPYKKTLVLRVSADEEVNTYKVHLVPYFKSHLDTTGKLYRATHHIRGHKTGGLLHWIGQREVLLDYDMRLGRGNAAVRARIESFRLPQLARVLASARHRCI